MMDESKYQPGKDRLWSKKMDDSGSKQKAELPVGNSEFWPTRMRSFFTFQVFSKQFRVYKWTFFLIIIFFFLAN